MNETQRLDTEWLYNRLGAIGRAQARYGFLLGSYPALSWLFWYFTQEKDVTASDILGISVKFPAVLILWVMPFVLSSLIVAWVGTFYAARATKNLLSRSYLALGGNSRFALYDIDTEHKLFDWWDHGNPWRLEWPYFAYAVLIVIGWISIFSAWLLMGPGGAISTAFAAGSGAFALPIDWTSVALSVYSVLCWWMAIAASYRLVFRRTHRFILKTFSSLSEADIDTRLTRWERPKDRT